MEWGTVASVLSKMQWDSLASVSSVILTFISISALGEVISNFRYRKKVFFPLAFSSSGDSPQGPQLGKCHSVVSSLVPFSVMENSDLIVSTFPVGSVEQVTRTIFCHGDVTDPGNLVGKNLGSFLTKISILWSKNHIFTTALNSFEKNKFF